MGVCAEGEAVSFSVLDEAFQGVQVCSVSQKPFIKTVGQCGFEVLAFVLVAF